MAKKKYRPNSNNDKSKKNSQNDNLTFAKALRQLSTNNPNDSSSTKSATYSKYSRDNIIQWLQNPTSGSNEKSIRNASIYMYLASMHYKRLLAYYAGLFVGCYVISPLGFSRDDVKDNFVKQYKKVSKSLELMNIPSLMHNAILVALREGAFYGVLLKDNTTAFIQKIDADYCKITAICDGSFLYSVDMTKISDKLEFYPPEFTAMHANYLRTGDKWQEVPIDISVCIKSDETLVDYSIPPFAAVMPSLYSLAAIESLQETASEIKNYKMLSGKIPVDSNGNPLISGDLIKEYYQQVRNALGGRVGLALTPFDFQSYTFENKTGVTDVDDFSNSTSNFWATAGTSGLLHGKENNTAGVTKLAIKNDETFVAPMVKQFERVINRYLKTAFSGTTKFKITILPVTVFNTDEYLKYYKEAAAFGIGKSFYAAALGISQNDVSGLDFLEKEVIHFDELSPLKSSYTISGSENSEIGRPQSDDGELTPSGENTRNNDANANR